MSVCATFVSCLVTEQIKFDQEENLPPCFLDKKSSQTPIGSMITVDLTDFTSTGPKEVTVELQVRDENLTQKLVTRYQLSTLNASDLTPHKGAPHRGNEVGSGSLLREFAQSIPVSDFTPGQCYQLDLVVTRRFDDNPDPEKWDQPAIEGDLDRARWLIAVSTSSGEPANLKTCPSGEYKPSEYSTSEVRDR